MRKFQYFPQAKPGCENQIKTFFYALRNFVSNIIGLAFYIVELIFAKYCPRTLFYFRVKK